MPDPLMAISLWQPWASMIPQGRKRYETRSWKPPERLVGQELAIHAAKTKKGLDGTPADDLPFGALVAVVRLGEVFRTEDVRDRLPPEELQAGNYCDGRYAWRLDLIRPIRTPLGFKGMQGIWMVPAGVAAVVRRGLEGCI